MKKIKLMIFCLLVSSSLFSIFESSPWIIVDNQTPLHLDCQIQVTCYRTIDEKIFSLKTKNNQNISMQYQNIIDENGDPCIFFNLNIDCNPQTMINLDKIFVVEDGWINPTIVSVAFVQKSLQLTFFAELTTAKDRYFCATYEPYVGVTVTAQPIPIYLKCLHSLQYMISLADGAIGYIIKWRP